MCQKRIKVLNLRIEFVGESGSCRVDTRALYCKRDHDG